jgi:histone H3/H4
MRTFKNYIHKLIKETSHATITMDAKLQLDAILMEIVKLIITTATRLLKTVNKITLTVKELVNATRLLFTGELLENILKEGDKRIKNDFYSKKLVIPPSLVYQYIKINKFPKMKISQKCSAYVAMIIEYICIELIDLASVQTLLTNHARITSTDLQNAVDNDRELSAFFNNNGINFIIQNTHVLSQSSFSKLAHNILESIDSTDTKIAVKTNSVLQFYIEKQVLKNVLILAAKITKEQNRVKINRKDILFAYRNLYLGNNK